MTRTINGIVSTAALSPSQSALLSAITGGADGRVTLGGSFSFDPSGSFSTWFSSTTAANITTPMTQLRATLADLAAAIRSEAADRALANRVTAANSVASGLARDASGKVLTTIAGLAGVARAGGVSTDQAPGAVAAQVAGLSSTDGITGFNIVGNVTDYLWQQFKAKAGQIKVDPADYLRIYSDLAAPGSGYKNDPAGHYRDHGMAEIRNGARGFIPQAFDWKSIGISIPGFAAGGDHLGGLRIVGERGPELEATGRARIYSAPQTRQMLGGNDQAQLERAVRDLKTEVERMRNENNQLLLNIGSDSRKQRQIAERKEALGTPTYTVEAPV